MCAGRGRGWSGTISGGAEADGHPNIAKVFDAGATGRRERVSGPNSPATLHCGAQPGPGMTDERQYPEAEKIYRRQLQAYRQKRAPSDPTILNTENSLALVLQNEGHNRASISQSPQKQGRSGDEKRLAF